MNECGRTGWNLPGFFLVVQRCVVTHAVGERGVEAYPGKVVHTVQNSLFGVCRMACTDSSAKVYPSSPVVKKKKGRRREIEKSVKS